MDEPRVLQHPAAADAPMTADSVTPDSVTPLRRRHAVRLSPSDEPTVVPFRRRPGQQRVRRLRRHPVLRFLPPFFTAVTLVAVPLAIVFWLVTSPRFALDQFEIHADVDGGRISETWAREALAPALGDNLWRLPLGAIEERLRQHEWIAAVEVGKRPPNTLVVHVTEKQVAALYRHERELWYVDSAGALIAPWQPRPDAVDLPLISGGDPNFGLASALAVADELERVAPPWHQGLSEIEILSDRDFRVFTRDLPFPLLVRSGTLDIKARRLQALLPYFADRFGAVAAVDLRFARRIIVQPSGQRAELVRRG